MNSECIEVEASLLINKNCGINSLYDILVTLSDGRMLNEGS